ncbi:MAG: YfhO family protein, partial [Lachnospiraceae bacterium]|nr:YfhO family protein [Lachnospiraceae bacterium]
SISKITANIGQETKTFSNVKRGYVLDMGYCPSGTNIQLTTDEDANVTATCYRLDEVAYAKAMTTLQETPLVVDAFGDTYVTGHVDAAEDGTMLVTIPFEAGWTVKVDGEEIEPTPYKDAFFAIPLEKGAHSIEFTYVPDGYALGAKISLGSLAALLIVILITYLTNKKKSTKKEADVKKKNPLRIEAPALEDSPSVGEGEIDHVITIDDLPRGDETPVAPEETTES